VTPVASDGVVGKGSPRGREEKRPGKTVRHSQSWFPRSLLGSVLTDERDCTNGEHYAYGRAQRQTISEHDARHC